MPEPRTIITLMGCGAMGSALLRGWMRRGTADEYWVVAPHQDKVEPFQKESTQIQWFESPEDLPGAVENLVIAVKPFVVEEALTPYQSLLTPDALVISVATGKPLSLYKEQLGVDVVRAMPNTPVSINQGVIGLVAAPRIKARLSERVHKILGGLGYLTWVNEEVDLDRVTALSGSGPAYVFYMIEAMAKAGESLGLPADETYQMALHTVAGAGAYAVSSNLPASTLRKNVTSPNGTTEKALEILMADQGLGDVVEAAIKAAYKRAEELRQ